MKRLLSVPGCVLAFALFGATTFAWPQEAGPAYPTPDPQSQAQQPSQQVWTPDQLDNLVAPIALYPDPLLGQMLVASTYPLEVVEASQWLQRNRNLSGQALVDAAKQQPWDPSVQALVAVPDALAKLNQDISWTTDLGNAFLAQQADVMNAVQRMRARARANGHLSSTPQQVVRNQQEGGQQVIVIQPAEPQVIYVPTYDPYYIWGPPVYGYYPALYYPPFGFGFGIGFNLGFCFGDWWGWSYWGWGPSWFGHTIYCNDYFFHHYGYHGHYGYGHGGREAWVHDPGHRMHVPYGNDRVAARFGGRTMGPGGSYRAGPGSRGAVTQYANRSQGPSAGRTVEQGYRGGTSQQTRGYRNAPREQVQAAQRNQPSQRQYGTTSQAQAYQSQPRQGYQTSQRYQSPSREYGTTSQAQSYRNPPREQPQASQRYQSPPRQYGTTSGSQAYQGQAGRSYESPQQYRQGPRVVPFGSQSVQAPQQYRSAPQVYRTPQVQGYQSQPRMSYQAPRQYSSAPQMSAPRSSYGGGFSRGGGASYSRGGGSSYSRGGGGSFSRGGGGHHR